MASGPQSKERQRMQFTIAASWAGALTPKARMVASSLPPQSWTSCATAAFSGSPAPPMAQPMVSMMRLLALSTVAGSRSSKRVLRTFSDQAAMIALPSPLPMLGGHLAHELGDVGDGLQLQEGFDGSIRLLAGQHARGVVPELLDDLLIGHPRSAGRPPPRPPPLPPPPPRPPRSPPLGRPPPPPPSAPRMSCLSQQRRRR